MNKQQAKVLVTRKLPQAVEKRLIESYQVSLNKDDITLDKQQLLAAMQEYDALIPTVSDRIDADILSVSGRKVKIIANFGVGYNNIDINAARQQGITITNTPDVLTDATADIALFLILAVTRKTYAAELKLRENRWHDFSLVTELGTSIQSKTLGIIGMGRIGQATAKRATMLGMNVIFYNRSPLDNLEFEAKQLGSIDAVMSQADVVSLHASGGGDAPIITAEHITRLKPSAYLINTARGDCVDQEALISALAENRIAGAGLDVYIDEPGVPETLRKLENVSLLPHIGSATLEVRTAMGMLALDNLDAYFAGTSPPSKVV